ncbi:unnamed protein product [Adineta steineri]|uniref:G-protein coupled receptors family 1 profile domain-containing protein n=1 Tax=Adineta steineri TaxID=433720 RepID=A0A819S6X2_9BILA|nr:unnamed protein product [Adineta steineri]
MFYFNLPLLYASKTCIILLYAYNIAASQISFAFVTFSIHRFCSIVFHSIPFFKTKRWVIICITSHWLVVYLISLPFILRNGPYCTNTPWMQMYTLFMVVPVPALINTALNMGIFLYVRSSTRRIQPRTMTVFTTGSINRQPTISRRDIALMKQMIYMFTMFIGGWTPPYLLLVIDTFPVGTTFVVFYVLVIWAELVLLGIIINLFKCNHDLREYLLNQFRRHILRL